MAVQVSLFQRRGDGDRPEFEATRPSLPASEPPAAEDTVERPTLEAVTDFGQDSGADPSAEDEASAAGPTLLTIGRYALKRVLGKGGLGTVFEAWDPLLSRMVAVKTLHFDADGAARERLDALFLNEARAAAGLSHTYIVTVHDAGLSPQGVYIAMERLRGRDLRVALQEGWRPTPAEAALLARRVADALAYAHAHGVVHCDIKPANIFLGLSGRPKVLDFGIARVAHRAALPALDGLVAGSPYYLAPEQLDGGELDPRTDQYSLGVVLYELLTGTKPFDGASLEPIVQAVRQGQPQPVHERCPQVPVALSAIVQRAMARRPEDRFDKAADMAHALRRWLATAAVLEAAAAGAAAASPAAVQPVAPAPHLAAAASLPDSAARRSRPWAWVGALAALIAAAAGWFAARAPADAADTGTATAIAPTLPDMPPAPAPAPVAMAGPAGPPPATALAIAADTTDTTGGTASGTTSGTAISATAAATSAGAASAQTDPAAASDRAARAAGGASAAANMAAAGPAAAARARPATPPSPRAADGARNRKAQVAPIPVPTAPAAPGAVQFAISPWGAIEIDGEPAGVTPPLSRLELPAGAHTITVRNGDFPPHTVRVQVEPDRPAVVRHRFGS